MPIDVMLITNIPFLRSYISWHQYSIYEFHNCSLNCWWYFGMDIFYFLIMFYLFLYKAASSSSLPSPFPGICECICFLQLNKLELLRVTFPSCHVKHNPLFLDKQRVQCWCILYKCMSFKWIFAVCLFTSNNN